jgi:hypothetical protein
LVENPQLLQDARSAEYKIHTQGDKGEKANIFGSDSIGHFQKKKEFIWTCVYF